MIRSPLQVILFTSGFVFLIFALDAYKRKKLNLLHFLVFGGGSVLVVISLFYPNFLARFSRVFGVANGADLIVYVSIIGLVYVFFELLHKITKDDFYLTQLVTHLAIDAGRREYESTYPMIAIKNSQSDFIFFMRGYNEGSVIGTTIDEIFGAGYNKLLYIDDGSKDDTLATVYAKRVEYPDCRIILCQHDINRGRGGAGAAMKTGIAYLKKYGHLHDIQYVVGFDADGQMDISDMVRFQSSLTDHPEGDVWLGSRFVEGGSAENMPRMRKIILRGGQIITTVFNGSKVSDPHNGFRMWKLPALQKISLTSDGMVYANELNEQIQYHHLHAIEVPVHIRYTVYSLHKGQKNTNARKILMNLIYHKLFFR